MLCIRSRLLLRILTLLLLLLSLILLLQFLDLGLSFRKQVHADRFGLLCSLLSHLLSLQRRTLDSFNHVIQLVLSTSFLASFAILLLPLLNSASAYSRLIGQIRMMSIFSLILRRELPGVSFICCQLIQSLEYGSGKLRRQVKAEQTVSE